MKLPLLIYYLFTQITIIHTTNQYLGCFIDQIGNRDLSTFIGDHEQLIPKQCIVECRAQNFLYAAIQYGNECRCGQQFGKHGPASDEECDYLCSTGEKCGGDFRNSVYDVLNSVIDSPLSFEKLARVKKAVAINDTTQTTDVSSRSATLSNSMSSDTVSFTTISSQPLMTTNSNTISSISSSTNDVFNVVHSSIGMSSVPSSTQLPSTTMTFSHLSAGASSTLTDSSMLSTMSPSSTSLTSASQSSVNMLTNVMHSAGSSPIYSITSPPDASTNTSAAMTGTATAAFSQTSSHMDTTISTNSNTFIPFNTLTSSNTNAAPTNTIQSIPTSYTSQFNSNSGIQSTNTINTASSAITITTNAPISSEFISTSSNLLNTLSSSAILSNNPSSFSSMMTTESSTISTIMSVYTSQVTPTISQKSRFISSIPNTPLLSTNTLAINSVSTEIPVTVASSYPAGITVQTSVVTTTVTTTITITTITTATTATTQTLNSTASTASTSTVSSSNVISTVIVVPLNATFDPNDNTTRETIRTRLSTIINLAFRCLTDSSYPNCTQSRQRIKRQLCFSGFNVNLVSNILEIASTSTSRRFLVEYIVNNPCNQNSIIYPVQVRTATSTLSKTQIENILGYDYEGDLVRSTTIGPTDSPTTDRKLWIIGAVLGPVAFALLLICTFCYLHYKCRPRPTNRTLAKVIASAPTVSPRPPTYQTISEAPVQEKPTAEKGLHALIQNDPLVATSPSTRRLTPILSVRSSVDRPEHPISDEISMDEIRRQNDVERWRNKLRLQEKFQQASVPNTNRSESSHYDNRAFEHDPSHINIQPATEITSNYSPRSMPKTTEIQAGRSKLHRLLDEVLDKADSDEVYNPDSDSERLKRRRQRRRNHSMSNDEPSPHPETPHVSVIPQVTERPDPSLIRLRYNPYEAGDRAHEISRLTPVELKLKDTTDDQRSNQYSSRSNPPLFYDDTTIADRAATATNAYANPKRYGRTRLETDREAAMRRDGGQIDRRQHRFDGDAVYLDTIPKDRDEYRVQARTAWAEPDIDIDSGRASDYLTAKRSVANTRNIISSIHNELQHISGPSSSGDYLA